MASSLAVGEPCPVCGSKEHPVLAKTPPKMPTEAELKLCKRAADEGLEKAKEKSAECAELSGKSTALNDSVLRQQETLFEKKRRRDYVRKRSKSVCKNTSKDNGNVAGVASRTRESNAKRRNCAAFADRRKHVGNYPCESGVFRYDYCKG